MGVVLIGEVHIHIHVGAIVTASSHSTLMSCLSERKQMLIRTKDSVPRDQLS